MAADYIDLSTTNAGEVVAWLATQGISSVMRGGPEGGSIGGTVIVPYGGQRLVIEPGDRVSVIAGAVALS